MVPPTGPEDSTAKSSPLGSHLRLPAGKQVSLFVVAGPDKGKSFPCRQPRMVVGRRNADVVLNDPQVSQTHCVVEITPLRFQVRDLESANGTFVGNRRIQLAELSHLGEFRVGQSTLALVITPLED